MNLTPIEHQDPWFRRYRRQAQTNYLWMAVAGVMLVLFLGAIGLVMFVALLGYALLNVFLSLHSRNQQQAFAHYRQIESLFSLHSMIAVRQPLPQMRLWSASPDFLAPLAGYVLNHRPQHVLELGSGTSTVIVAYCLERNGHGVITAYDHDAAFAEQTRQRITQHNLIQWASVRHAPLTSVDPGDSQASWYDIVTSDLAPIDLLIIDGPPAASGRYARYPALPHLFDHLADSALIVIDDAARSDDNETILRWLAEYDLVQVESIRNEKGMVILQKKSDTPDEVSPTSSD